MINVYLDDFRTCPKGFVLAKNAEECKLLIDEESINILSLDFDLGWNEPNGYEVVRHMIEKQKYPNKIFLHTSSLIGNQQMYHALRENIPVHVSLYGGPMSEKVLEEVASKF